MKWSFTTIGTCLRATGYIASSSVLELRKKLQLWGFKREEHNITSCKHFTCSWNAAFVLSRRQLTLSKGSLVLTPGLRGSKRDWSSREWPGRLQFQERGWNQVLAVKTSIKYEGTDNLEQSTKRFSAGFALASL